MHQDTKAVVCHRQLSVELDMLTLVDLCLGQGRDRGLAVARSTV